MFFHLFSLCLIMLAALTNVDSGPTRGPWYESVCSAILCTFWYSIFSWTPISVVLKQKKTIGFGSAFLARAFLLWENMSWKNVRLGPAILARALFPLWKHILKKLSVSDQRSKQGLSSLENMSCKKISYPSRPSVLSKMFFFLESMSWWKLSVSDQHS